MPIFAGGMLATILLSATAVSGFSSSKADVSRGSRRALLDAGVCFSSCKNGAERGGFPFYQCQCTEGFKGGCCGDRVDCTAPDLTTFENIDLDEFTRATWYIQKQQETGYQPKENLNCVAATYDVTGTTVPFFSGTVLDVHNYANKKEVNGELSVPDKDTILCGRVPNEDDRARLSVAPCFLPNYFAGDYWVLDLGVDQEGQYEWAVIIGGQPKEYGEDGKCTTKTSGTNNSGLWLFSREPVASKANLDAMLQVLDRNGISATKLLDVNQAGCNYEGAFIKGATKTGDFVTLE